MGYPFIKVIQNIYEIAFLFSFMRQSYSLEQLQKIFSSFPGTGTIRKSFLFTSGFENSNYYAETDVGWYVIKIFEGMGVSRETILFEIEVMVCCTEGKLQTPTLLRSKKNTYYAPFEGKIAIVMDYLPGDNLQGKKMSSSLVQEIGDQVGRMDALLSKFKDGSKTRQNYEWDLKNFLQLEPSLQKLPSSFDRELLQKIFDQFKAIKPIFDTLPRGLIHNDLAAHNFLARRGKLTGIIDFSDMAFSPYIQNIAVFLCQSVFAYNWQPRQVNVFLQAYQKHNHLSAKELCILYDLVLARYAQIIVEFNRWNVDYGEEQQRTEYIKDYYHFLKKFMNITRTEFQRLCS